MFGILKTHDTVLDARVHCIDHIEKKKNIGHHSNLKVIGCRTMGCLTIGFNGENYIFPSGEFRIYDSQLEDGKYVLWE